MPAHSVRAAAVAAAALTLTLTPGIASAHGGGHHHRGRPGVVAVTKAPLTDLQPATDQPFDGARGVVRMRVYRHHTTVELKLRGVDRGAAGTTFGAHLHVGPCVAGDGAAAGPHYNTDVLAGDPTPEISRRTEVWLDFRVDASGRARSYARVPFVPQSGTRSIVIHALPTDGAGHAGARLACLPLAIG